MRTNSLLPVACLPVFFLAGCSFHPTAAPTLDSGAVIQGTVHGGQQAISGSHVYLLAANTTGYAGPGIAASSSNASVSLLSAAATGNADSIGAYVLTDSQGNFTISRDYSCVPNTQVYLYALGGNSGAGVNPAVGLLAALGNCPTAGNFGATVPFISINEASTVAAAYAFAGFATDATHVSSSGTALAQTGIANAFANSANLVGLGTGAALTTTPAGNGTVPQARIYTLANILAACVNSNGTVTGPPAATPCYLLFNNALSGGTSGTAPTDTATAAINIAHNPGANVHALYTLPPPASPFAPTLAMQPTDFILAIQFTGGGITEPEWIAIDGSGNAWMTNFVQHFVEVAHFARPENASPESGNSVTELSSLGAAISGPNGYTGGGMDEPSTLAIDASGNVWVSNGANPGAGSYDNGVTELSSSGTTLSPDGTGFLASGMENGGGTTVDRSGNVWISSGTANNVTELSGTGADLSGSTGYTGGGMNNPFAIAADASGHIWVANTAGNSVTELSSSGSVLSGPGGITGGGLNEPIVMAIDGSGVVWATNFGGNSITTLSSSGSILSGASGYTGGGIKQPVGIAIDGAGTAWVANSAGSVSAFSNSGVPISTSSPVGYTAGLSLSNTQGIAVDGSGDVWVPNVISVTEDKGNVAEFIGVATPVVTPLAVGVANNTLGTRP